MSNGQISSSTRLGVTADLQNVQYCTPTQFQVKRITSKSAYISSKLKLQQFAVISKVDTEIHFVFNQNILIIPCKYTNKNLKLLLPFISWKF